jgi:hypothetical protein
MAVCVGGASYNYRDNGKSTERTANMEQREIIEELGLLVDKAENFLGLQKLPLPTDMQIDSMKTGLAELRDRLKALRVALGYVEEGWEE